MTYGFMKDLILFFLRNKISIYTELPLKLSFMFTTNDKVDPGYDRDVYDTYDTQ